MADEKAKKLTAEVSLARESEQFDLAGFGPAGVGGHARSLLLRGLRGVLLVQAISATVVLAEPVEDRVAFGAVEPVEPRVAGGAVRQALQVGDQVVGGRHGDRC